MNCQYCFKNFNNPGGFKMHETSCKFNPNRVIRKRSVNAGAKKGCKVWNEGKKIGRHPVWDKWYPDHIIFSKNSNYPRHCLKARIRERNLIDYKCSCCGLESIWQGKPMPLILDHINGINNDNRIENLRFVCSNCDSQLPTYKSRNKK